MIALLLAAALAGRHEISYEYTFTGGPAWTAREVGADGANAFGLRGGASVLRDPSGVGVNVIASWSRVPRGYGWGSVENTNSIIDRWGVGAKVDYDVLGFFFPYGRIEARLVHVTSNLGGDGFVEPLTVLGNAPGGAFTAGVEFMLPDRHARPWPLTAGLFIEGGYAIEGPVRMGDLGSLRLGGPIVRSGLGLRFW